MKIHIHNLYKSYRNPVFEDFSISFKENEITCILGPSGCGKTTLLHIIGGLIRPDGGVLEGFQDKQLSYVFQDPRLLPWKTVCENIEFVLPKHLHASERKKQAEQLIKQVELEGFSCYYPAQLSGGMRQRVSISPGFCCFFRYHLNGRTLERAGPHPQTKPDPMVSSHLESRQAYGHICHTRW